MRIKVDSSAPEKIITSPLFQFLVIPIDLTSHAPLEKTLATILRFGTDGAARWLASEEVSNLINLQSNNKHKLAQYDTVIKGPKHCSLQLHSKCVRG